MAGSPIAAVDILAVVCALVSVAAVAFALRPACRGARVDPIEVRRADV